MNVELRFIALFPKHRRRIGAKVLLPLLKSSLIGSIIAHHTLNFTCAVHSSYDFADEFSMHQVRVHGPGFIWPSRVVIQRRAYGLRDQEYLRLKVLTCMLPAL